MTENEKKTSPPTLVIYHANCRDGAAAAMIAQLYLEQREGPRTLFEMHAASYGEEPPPVESREVYILDFSYDRETMLALHEKARFLVCLDHHKTAEEALADLAFCYFDMESSGAMLAYRYFETLLKHKIAPSWLTKLQRPLEVDTLTGVPVENTLGIVTPALHLIEDADLWLWEHKESRAFRAGIIGGDPLERFYDVLTRPNVYKDIIEQGEDLLVEQAVYIKEITQNAELVEIGGHTVPFVVAEEHVSEVGNELAAMYPAQAFAAVLNGKRLSLRSIGDFDVSKIAAAHGGGGHKNAAGFTCERKEFVRDGRRGAWLFFTVLLGEEEVSRRLEVSFIPTGASVQEELPDYLETMDEGKPLEFFPDALRPLIAELRTAKTRLEATQETISQQRTELIRMKRKNGEYFPTQETKHAHYFHEIPAKMTHLDVYAVQRLFDVKDPEIAHALKKLLMPGARGVKTKNEDIQQAIDSLERYLILENVFNKGDR